MLPLPALALAVVVAATPSSSTLPLAAAHAGVRAALATPRGDVDAAFAADDDAVGAGFAIRRLERTEPHTACARVAELVDGTDAALRALALPRHIQCLARSPRAPGVDVATIVSSTLSGPLGRDASTIDAAVQLVDAPDTKAVVVDTALAPLLSMPLPTSEPARRAAVARALRLLALHGSKATALAARTRLLDELPEQPADGVVDDDRDAPARRLTRAAVLERLQRNDDVLTTIGTLVDTSCEAALLAAKAQRKLRHYADARKAIARATRDACGETTKKARYLELRLASIQKGASVEALARRFAHDFGKDPLVDDVLLWLAETLHARGDEAGRDRALARIVEEFPDGDMADDARFRLALSAAARGDGGRAERLLDDAVKALRAKKKPRAIDVDRARYWSARLALFPDPKSLDVVADATRARAATAALASFARERGASFYGQLARRLLVVTKLVVNAGALGGEGALVDDAGQPRATLAGDAHVAIPPALARDARFALARVALDKGFDDEAATLLKDVVADAAFATDEGAVVAVAAAFVVAGRPDQAHQTLRNAGLALLGGEPRGDALSTWTLSWPRAWADEIAAAAGAASVPPPLLMGLAREESAFDANVVSWAGAVGLCQLMPPTAADEARAQKLPPPSTTELLDPAYNARLGAAHIGRRLRSMRHPLLAIAAYNAGPGAVAKWLPPSGTRLPLDWFVEQIPVEETRNYVKKVTGSWVIYTVLDGGGDLDNGKLAFDVWLRG